MKRIACHQYATGRGPTGYGFVAYSRDDQKKQEASFTFSLNKTVGLRFSQLPPDADYVFEIDPASTDCLHSGAFMTKNREEGGSSSVYTHVLITKEMPAGAEALGLLKTDNFLTPEEFSEVTHSERTLEVAEKNCELTEPREIPALNEGQKTRLSAFLARYWALMEQKEWGAKGTPELALQLPGMNLTEMIAFFAREIVPCLPEFLRPAISVSFGAKWNNRGSTPCVCCVLSDNSESPFPCYNLGIEGINNARQAGPVEQYIGELMVRKDPSLFPPTYCRIVDFAREDKSYAGMARSFSVLAYCIQINRVKGSVQDMRGAYDKLCDLADRKFGIKPEKAPYVFLPLIQDLFDQMESSKHYNPENVEWMIRQNIRLHRSEARERDPESLTKNDESLIKGFDSLNLEQMRSIIASIWQELRKDNLNSEEIFALLKEAEGKILEKYQNSGDSSLVKSAIDQCVRLKKEAGDDAKDLIGAYREWICRQGNGIPLLQSMNTSDILLQDEDMYFSFLEQVKEMIREGSNEEQIVDFLKACKRSGSKNRKRAEQLATEVYPLILKGISGIQTVSSDGFSVIADTILNEEQSKETIGPVIDFATRNIQNPDASAFLKQVAEKMVTGDEAGDQAYQEILFENLDRAAREGNQRQLEPVIRKLLEKTNNHVVSVRNLEICENVRQMRLKECLMRFFRDADLESEKKLRENWNNQYAKKYSCDWEELKEDDLDNPIKDRFEVLYDENRDQTQLLSDTWNTVTAEESSEYSACLKRIVTEKLDYAYDELWRGSDDANRQKLDQLIEECADSDAGQTILENREKTTAGKARNYINSLQNLSRTGMDRSPERAGKLISEMKTEKGFKNCFRIDSQMEHRPDDKLYSLVITLLQEIQKNPDSSDYWNKPLAELGFDRNTPVWSENGFRTMNILSYVTQCLDDMNVPVLGEDLKAYLGGSYMDLLWNSGKEREKWFKGNESAVLSGPLYQWLMK